MGLFSIFGGKSHSEVLLEEAQTKIQQQQATREQINDEVVPKVASDALLVVMDIFEIKGRGVVVTGVANSEITEGQVVTIRKLDGTKLPSTVGGIEKFGGSTGIATKGQNVGLLLTGVERSQISQGDKIIG